MDMLAAIILGLVQGITEFLPVSSSGHLVLVRELVNVDDLHGLAVDAVLHLATWFAVVIYFWRDVFGLIQTAVRKLSRLPVNERELTLLYAILIGTLPAVCVGLFLDTLISNYLYQTATVATVLFTVAIFFMYAEWRYYIKPPHSTISVRTGFLIGVWQILALVPGVSRSGITLVGGMLLGLSRHESARFSFLLAIPIIFGVGLKKLFELVMIGESVSWLPLVIGFIISFLVALVVIHLFLSFIRNHTLWPFIWYSVILSLLVGYVAVFIH
jgi:undecaprenyl-diphosphatase